MRRGAANVNDMSHRSATRLICPSTRIKLARLFTPHPPLNPRSSREFFPTSLRLLPPCRAALPLFQLAFTMSSAGALGGAGAGGPGESSGRKCGRPFGSRNKVKDPAATPPVPRKRGRPLGSHNKKTGGACGRGRRGLCWGGTCRRRCCGPHWSGCHHRRRGPH
jgi:hypothetical protein